MCTCIVYIFEMQCELNKSPEILHSYMNTNIHFTQLFTEGTSICLMNMYEWHILCINSRGFQVLLLQTFGGHDHFSTCELQTLFCTKFVGLWVANVMEMNQFQSILDPVFHNWHIYTIICRRSQTAGRNSCSIASGDVSYWPYRLKAYILSRVRISVWPRIFLYAKKPQNHSRPHVVYFDPLCGQIYN